ncbi:DNA repair protein RecN [Nitrospina gracilis]|uniref:DNA repair protein RecN n=1 Tax=Nitrospina gracilis TaxID=35801 RepID=UPI001F011091|nr:DNA repair protein RecN [Nitrospina gracilis]MCF8721961.1 DNA repair protein RecN (Recombination protein N) [Nitrospina gracilis Nb-211]
MLQELRITNFAIIDNLTVTFGPGLNILTGETGAGKSIIIDALNLILGGRADADSIRSSESSATVEAVLAVDDPATLDAIREMGIEVEDNQVLIKRLITLEGKNRTYLNNSPLTVSALATVGQRLVDIHGQHDHQSLLHAEHHVGLLDRYGKLGKEKAAYQSAWSAYRKKVEQLNHLLNHQSDRLQRQDLLQFQVKEIDDAALSVGEDEELRAEKHKLNHAEKLSAALDQVLAMLSDQEGSVLDLLGRIDRELGRLPEIDPALEPQSTRAGNAFIEAQELEAELRDYVKHIDFSPTRLEEIEDRLAEINGLKRKYGNDIAVILEYRQKIGDELESLSLGEEAVDGLKKEIAEHQKEVAKLAVDLAKKREQAADTLQKAVEKELKDLSMKHVRFGVRFDYEADADGFTTYNKKTVKAHGEGIGSVEFLFSPNLGEALKPLARIASGGELSRVMLALKSILNEQDDIPILVFDEVDAGIGGKVAEKVGVKLKKIAATKQVFCITHLPQIAGMATAHYRVHKSVTGKRTRSTITELSYDERVEEIARMSGGETITDATLQYAREMIQPAPLRGEEAG